MRLTSIAVRNYRVHRELTAELDAARTLVGGPNESGKSTLVEAIQRVFFLKAKAGGETREEMISTHGGHPEVEIKFEGRGKSWHLIKRFSGTNGAATLTEAGGGTWNGDEAETRLAALLGAEIFSGRSAGERAAEQWAHIWISQGTAGKDPAAHANAQRDALMARLQDGDGAAAMQSALDARVAGTVAKLWDSTFRKAGEARSGSEWFAAIKEEEEANAALETAQQIQVRLEQAVLDFQQAEKAIREAAAALESLRPQLQAAEAKIARVRDLQSEEKLQAAAVETAADKLSSLTKAEKEIRALHTDIESRRKAMAPGETDVQRQAEEEKECRQREVTAEHALQETGALVRTARLRRELATAHGQRLERTAGRDALLLKLAEILKVREKRADLMEKLTKLPPVTEAALKKLQTLDREYSNEEAALNAMAAGVEVIASGTPVTVDGQTLTPGKVHIIKEDAEVAAGTTRLRIRPGGGKSLTEARQRVQEAGVKRQRVFDELGVASLNAAAEAAGVRRQMESDLKSITARLDGMGDSRVDTECSVAEQSCAAAEAEVARRGAAVTDFPAPATLTDARAQTAEWSQRLADEESKETAARAAREAAALATQTAADLHTKARQRTEEERRKIGTAEAQLDYLLKTHGAEDTRLPALAERSAALEAAEKLFTATRRALAELQPELLEADRQRLQRAIAQHSTTRTSAETERAVAQSALVRDGTTDPQADLAMARERARAATAHRESKERHAKAIQLLNEQFLAAKQELADRFTRPLAERVSGYLECLFGPGTRAEVRLEEDQFTSLQLIRPAHAAGAFDFRSLSGGAKEQLAAAFRLAMAEVLAAGHDGCLPVVFDDAFAYADPERVQILQRMLDLAASRGLQIIVLTCTPADYAALGAKQILLPPPGAPLP